MASLEQASFGERSAASDSVARDNRAAARTLTLSHLVVVIGLGLFVLLAA